MLREPAEAPKAGRNRAEVSKSVPPVSETPPLPPPLPFAQTATRGPTPLFTSPHSRDTATAVKHASGSARHWQLVVGQVLPDASQLFDLQAARKPGKRYAQALRHPPTSTSRSLVGPAIWLTITQSADVFIRTMASGLPDDPQSNMRIGISVVVVCCCFLLAGLPRFRAVLVALGAVALGLLQFGTLAWTFATLMERPADFTVLAASLLAQVFALLAIVGVLLAAVRPASPGR